MKDGSSQKTRVLRMRVTAALAVAPITFTDLTAPQVVGVEPRQCREIVAAKGIPHARVGHRIIVRVDHWLAAIERLASEPRSDRESGDTLGDDRESHAADEDLSATDLLAELGLRRVGGSR